MVYFCLISCPCKVYMRPSFTIIILLLSIIMPFSAEEGSQSAECKSVVIPCASGSLGMIGGVGITSSPPSCIIPG